MEWSWRGLVKSDFSEGPPWCSSRRLTNSSSRNVGSEYFILALYRLFFANYCPNTKIPCIPFYWNPLYFMYSITTKNKKSGLRCVVNLWQFVGLGVRPGQLCKISNHKVILKNPLAPTYFYISRHMHPTSGTA